MDGAERDKLLAKLRETFPAGTLGILPKPYKKDSPRGKCDVCGGFHGLPAAHLDFVGHAAVTDRLLSIDPGWTWEPAATDETGNPVLDREGNLWIRLTVCGVTRLGVGDGPSMKERIGDAIRNAAMRFGVALSLWTKDELESGAGEVKATTGTPQAPAEAPATDGSRRAQGTVRRAPQAQPPHDPATGEITGGDEASQKQLNMIRAILARDFETTDDDDVLTVVSGYAGRSLANLHSMTKAEASTVIDRLKEHAA